jgi:hypothetical protein
MRVDEYSVIRAIHRVREAQIKISSEATTCRLGSLVRFSCGPVSLGYRLGANDANDSALCQVCVTTCSDPVGPGRSTAG